MLEGKTIPVFNHGNHARDFTHADYIVEDVIRSSDQIPQPLPPLDSIRPDSATINVPFHIFDVGNNNPLKLSVYIEAIEAALGKKAIKDPLPLQAGNVHDTFSDSSELEKAIGYKPATPVTQSEATFMQLYRQYFRV